jgi:3-isopropylmalate/(R)-2-methylmalate dehydratase small subunit
MSVRGAVYVLGDNIDTDQIIPAEYLNLVPTIPDEYRRLGSHALAGLPLAPGAPPFIPAGAMTSPYTIVVAGKNFGCGSSREHAPVALGAAGTRVVVAESFARIFFRNCVATGELYPVETLTRLLDAFVTGDEAECDLEASTLTNRRTGRVRSALLHGAQRQRHVLDPPPRSLRGDGLAAPERAQDRHVLAQPLRPLLPADAEGLALHLAVAGAEACDQPPAAQHVDRRELLGERDRVEERGDEDPEADADPLGRACEVARKRDRLEERRARDVVVAEPDRVEAELLREERLLGDRSEAFFRGRAGWELRAEEEADSHASATTRSSLGATSRNCGMTSLANRSIERSASLRSSVGMRNQPM